MKGFAATQSGWLILDFGTQDPTPAYCIMRGRKDKIEVINDDGHFLIRIYVGIEEYFELTAESETEANAFKIATFNALMTATAPEEKL